MIFLSNRNLLLSRREELAAFTLFLTNPQHFFPPSRAQTEQNCDSNSSPTALGASRILSVSHRGNKTRVLVLPVHYSKVDPPSQLSISPGFCKILEKKTILWRKLAPLYGAGGASEGRLLTKPGSFLKSNQAEQNIHLSPVCLILTSNAT